MKLYDLELSGNCYKIRLFLAMIGKSYQLVPVDFLDGEHARPPLSDLNPFKEIPILEDGNLILRDSQAILVYLAREYADAKWCPMDNISFTHILSWLMFAESEIARGPNDARLHDKFGFELDHSLAVTKSQRVLTLLEQHLSDREWLVGDNATIADIACFPYVALGHEGRVPIGEHRAVRAWIDRIKALPGFIGMPDLQ